MVCRWGLAPRPARRPRAGPLSRADRGGLLQPRRAGRAARRLGIEELLADLRELGVGDRHELLAEVGADANIGAGSITANYDGRTKHRTKIGQGARIAVNNSLVAPVSVGDGAYTGAGAVIREDVPPGDLAVSVDEQRNIEGYAERKAEQAREGEGEPDS